MRGAILIISLASLLSATTYCYKDKTRCFFVDDGSNKTEIIRNKAKFLKLASENGVDGETLIGDFDSSDGYYDDDNYRQGVFIPPPYFYDDPWDDDPDYIFIPPHHPDYLIIPIIRTGQTDRIILSQSSQLKIRFLTDCTDPRDRMVELRFNRFKDHKPDQ